VVDLRKKKVDNKIGPEVVDEPSDDGLAKESDNSEGEGKFGEFSEDSESDISDSENSEDSDNSNDDHPKKKLRTEKPSFLIESGLENLTLVQELARVSGRRTRNRNAIQFLEQQQKLFSIFQRGKKTRKYTKPGRFCSPESRRKSCCGCCR